MPLISLAMIVKNEEATLAHCLKSVKPLVDEIVIVDTGSTDGTIEIAKGFNAKIHHFEWCDDFSAARNESIKHCTGDWLLVLDADEAIDPLDYKKICDACLNPSADAYSFIHRHYKSDPILATHDSETVPNVSAYSEGKDIPYYSDKETLRLVKVYDGLMFTGRIHEQISPSLISRGKSFVALDAVIHHYGKLFAERLEYKTQYYLTLARQEVEKNPSSAWAQFNLLQQALVAGHWEVALGAAQACIDNGTNMEPYTLYGKGMALQELGRHNEAIESFDELLTQAPHHALGMAQKGASLVAMGDINAGRQLVVRALELLPGYAPVHIYLANLDYRLNNLNSARNTALKALRIAPTVPSLYSLLLNIEVASNNQSEAAKYALQGIRNCPRDGNLAWYRVASAYLLKEGQLEDGKSVLDQGLIAFPDDPDLIKLRKMI